MKRLSALCNPMSPEEFLANVWDKRPAHFRGPAGRFDDVLSEAAFTRLLWEAEFAPREFRVVRSGVRAPELFRRYELAREAWHAPPSLDLACEAMGGEATLVTNSLELRNDGCLALCASLLSETARLVAINGYLSPPGTESGLRAHYDSQHNFMLQISGTKDWEITAPTQERVTRQPDDHADSLPPGLSVRSVRLEPGDCLYLPRGWWHLPRTLQEPSLHLTVALPAWTRADVATWAAHIMESDPKMREDLPLELDPAVTQHRVRAELGTAFAYLADICSNPASVDRLVVDRFLGRAKRYLSRKSTPSGEDQADR